MHIVRTAILAGLATAALAGAAIAADKAQDNRMMLVALPDGSVQHIRYAGDGDPQVVFVRDAAPTDVFDAAFGPGSPFAEMDRISAMMEARGQAMMRQAAQMQAAEPAANGQGVVMTNAPGQPVGTMHYSYVSSTTDAQGCTQTVSYNSNDADAAGQPRMIRTSAGSCGDAGAAKPTNPVTPTAAPSPKPAAKVTPVSAPRPLPEFTPSHT